MPKVRVDKAISCDIEKAWKLVVNVEAYPSLMKSVKSVKVIDRNDNSMLTEWKVELKESEMSWTEKEVHSAENFRIDFSQIKGDLEQFEGYWQLTKQSENETIITLEIDLSIGIPALDEILNPIAVDALHENSCMMLDSLNSAALNQEN